MEENEVKTEVKQPTYEELKNYCNQLFVQNREMSARLAQITNTLNKLPYLFKVIENSQFFDLEFVDDCTKEIIEIMTPPTQEEISEDNKAEE